MYDWADRADYARVPLSWYAGLRVDQTAYGDDGEQWRPPTGYLPPAQRRKYVKQEPRMLTEWECRWIFAQENRLQKLLELV